MATCQNCDQLGDIHGTATAKTDDAIDLLVACKCRCAQHHCFGRICLNVGINGEWHIAGRQ